MLPKRFGPVDCIERGHIVLVRTQGPVLRNVVLRKRAHAEHGCGEGFLDKVGAHVREQQASVPVVGYAAAVVDLGNEISQCIPGRVRIVAQVDAQDALTDLEVGIVEVVGDVPAAKGPVLEKER
jgi:hypothetical protein